MNITTESLRTGTLCVVITPETQAERYQVQSLVEAALKSGVGDVSWRDYDGTRGHGVMLRLIPDPFKTGTAIAT